MGSVPPQGTKIHVCCACVHVCVCAHLLQLCPTLCNPRDCSPPGGSVQGILQAGILEWVAMPSSRGSSQPEPMSPESPASQTDSLPTEPPGKPCLLCDVAQKEKKKKLNLGSGPSMCASVPVLLGVIRATRIDGEIIYICPL